MPRNRLFSSVFIRFPHFFPLSILNSSALPGEVLQASKSLGELSVASELRLVALELQREAWLLTEEVHGAAVGRVVPVALGAEWHAAWNRRPFHFNAGLDSSVAAAVVSIAHMAARRATRGRRTYRV